MIPVKLPTTQEVIGMPGVTIGDFWAWAYSDVLSNGNGAVFAEFIVGCALGVVDTPRIEWDAVDLRYAGKRIEVKSAAYVQSWAQTKPSLINFDIAEKRGWDAETNISAEQGRGADIYVFCLYPEQDREIVNVLNVPHWQFYVVPTEQINLVFGRQKKIVLNRMKSLCELPVSFDKLRERIDAVLANGACEQPEAGYSAEGG